MASTALLGFIKGASGEALDSLHRREQADEELRKQQLLEKLRLETEQEMAVFRDKLDAGKVDAQLSSDDYTGGKRILRNNRGEQIGSVDLTDDEKNTHKMALDKENLGMENTRSEIAYRGTQADLERQRLGIEARNSDISAQRLALDKKNDGTITADGKPVLLAEYNKTMQELKDANANPRVLANFQTAWYEGVNQSGWTPKDQREFLKRTREHWTTGVTLKNGQRTKPLLDSPLNNYSTLETALANSK